MRSIMTWPRVLPSPLGELYAAVEARLEAEMRPFDTGDALVAAVEQAPRPVSTLIVVDAAASGDDVADTLQHVGAQHGASVVAVVGDGYLGTEHYALAPAAAAGAALAAVRSLAIRRDSPVRANAVCVPDVLFERPTAQRGPLRHQVNAIDVAEAVAFLLGPEGGYLSGQTLHVNGGRQLFSSQTA